MYAVRINITRIKIEGCPTSGIAAVDWRREHGLPAATHNDYRIEAARTCDEAFCRRHAAALDTHADLVVSDSWGDQLVLDAETVARLELGDDDEVRETLHEVVDRVLADQAARTATQAREAEERRVRQAAQEVVDAEERQRRADIEAIAEAERATWIEAHGSDHLRRLVAEQIECQRVYRSERIALEYPGWRRYYDVSGHVAEPKNPSPAALVLLDEARASAGERTSAAGLQWFVDDESEEWDDDGQDRRWRGYVALLDETETFAGCGDLIFGGALDK